jgi:hypothetical protein
MKIKLASIGVAVLSFWIVGCSGGAAPSGVSHESKDGRLAFRVPEAWVLKSETSGLRFGRADNPEDRSTLLVKTDPRGDDSLDRRQAIGLQQIEQQGAELLEQDTFSRNGWEGWEATFRQGNVSVYTIWLFDDAVRVEVKLIAPTDQFAGYLDDVKAVAASIRPQ